MSKFFHLNKCKYRISSIAAVTDVEARNESKWNNEISGYVNLEVFSFSISLGTSDIWFDALYEDQAVAVATHAELMKVLEEDD